MTDMDELVGATRQCINSYTILQTLKTLPGNISEVDMDVGVLLIEASRKQECNLHNVVNTFYLWLWQPL